MSDVNEQQKLNEADVPPPVLGTWKNLYTFLVVELLVTVALLFALTRWAS